MWRNYWTGIVRTVAKNRAYVIINVAGLAIGMAACVMILSYVRYERSYDSWLADVDRVYQVQTTWHPPGQADIHSQASPFPVDEMLPAAFPQVEAVTSVASGKTVIEHDGLPMFLDATTVDPDFFKVFALPFAQGSAATALPDTNSIVLTQSEAIRQFGTADALGKTLSLGAGAGKRDYRVSGVLRDLPHNTSLKIGIMYRRDLNAIPAEVRGWGNADQQHYVKLRRGADAGAINAAIPAWKQRMMPPHMIGGKMASLAGIMDLRLVPITAVHLGLAQVAALRPGGDPRALATFGVVALLTLGMAVMNFVNLTTALAIRRAREIALRKVVGASRSQLIAQFLFEALVISAAAMLIALSVAEVALPWIGRQLGVELQIAYTGKGGMLLPALGLLLATTLTGGLYPALFLSRFRPAAVLHGSMSSAATPGSERTRAALVVLEFAIAIGLIASTAIIYSQTRFVERVDPGYRRDGLVQIANGWRFTKGAEFDAARRELLGIPGVTGVGRTSKGVGSTDTAVRLTRAPAAGQYQTMTFTSVDKDFLPTIRVDLLAGRLPGDRFALDRIVPGTSGDVLARRGINVVINRSAAAKLGYRAPAAAVGNVMQVAFDGFIMVPSTIVGVVEDTRFGSVREAAEPIVYAYDPEHTNEAVVRFPAARPAAIIGAVGRVWHKFEPEIPFEARFADDIANELYAAERARTVLFAAFSILAIVIASLGLFGLAAFTAERRTKEIGIRKVLGARTRDIVRLLVWQFSRPVVIANVIAWPVAWWLMRDWLNGFDQRIPLTPVPFVIAAVIALGIAIATVVGHAVKVARANPIHALRYE
jgi:putative ABC transport system permease protein